MPNCKTEIWWDVSKNYFLSNVVHLGEHRRVGGGWENSIVVEDEVLDQNTVVTNSKKP